MKWILINISSEGIHEYHLIEEDQLVMILKFNPETHSFRISSAENKRLFFMENAGSLTGKYVLKNEYGMPIGNLNSDKWTSGGGFINIDKKRYTYKISGNAETVLNIYNEDHPDSALTCSFSISNSKILLDGKLLNGASCSLLMGLCWFLSSSIKREVVAA